MFDTSTLKQRLSEWSDQFEQDFPVRPFLPILLYQAVFTFVHTLKSSFHTSTDHKIRELLPELEKLDTLVRRLAYDQMELEDLINDELYYLVVGRQDNNAEKVPPTIEKLVEFFQRTTPLLQACAQNEDLQVLKLNYTWEDFSKARAQCADRNLFKFYSKHKILNLSDLPHYDKELFETALKFRAVHINRKVNKADGDPSTQISVEDLFAFFQETPDNPEWKKVD